MPTLSPRLQLLIGLALAALMAMTRGQHFASVDALPSASTAVFFLAGLLLAPRWVFPALFLEASLLDYAAITWGGVGDWCVTQAYAMLIPAYGVLWLAGRWLARRPEAGFKRLALALAVLLVSGSLAHLCSSGGFYFLSGRYPEPTLAVFVQRLGGYLPRALANLALYVSLAAVLQVALNGLFKAQARDALR